MNEQNYAGNETVLRNDALAGQTIQLGSTTRDGLPLQGSFQPNWAGIILSLTLFGVILMFAIKQMFGSSPFRQTLSAFNRLSKPSRMAFLAFFMGAVVYGGLLDKEEDSFDNLYSRTSPSVLLTSSEELMASIPEAVQLTESQQLAGFALTAVVTNETFDLSAPTNAVIHANWLKRGAAEDGFWVPVGIFCLGTNHYDSVYVSSSGTLSFNHPKSSAVARLMPDGSSIAFLAPLQTVLGIPPETNWNLLSATNSLFWHDVTTYGSARFTWQNALLTRATNAPLSFQAELFPSGDFIYRYDFSSITNYQLRITNYVVGAQNNGGGETALIATDTHSCSGTNHLCALLYRLDGTNLLTTPLCSVATNSQKFSLYWTAFGEFDSANPDPDDDGITTPDEVLIHHTDPHMPDSDLDGVSDGDELAIGTNPLDPDGDNDGIPDGLDVQPLVWNDADDDTDGDGLSLAEELLQGLDPAVADDIDTDGDGWEDWKEALAATSPTDFNDSPVNEDGSTKIFDVTIASGSMSGASVLLAVGDHRMIFGASATSYTLTLREGIAHPVSLYAATDCSVALTCTLGSSYALFRNPQPLFSGVGTLSGGRIALSGMIAQPAPSIVPDPLCFHTRDDIHVESSVLPEGMTGNWSWWMDCEPWTGDGNEVDLPYDDIDYPNYFESGFLAHGAASSRWVARTVTRCALLNDHPEWLEPDFDPGPPYPAEEPVSGTGTGGPGFDAYAGSGLLVPVNNDDDNANESLDTADSAMPLADNDLVGCYPLGWFNGQCCPCPEHQPRYADSATLLSSHLALWKDACKSNAFTETISAGEILYVEGLSESASVGDEEIVWQYTSGGQTHQLTNVFTVLSQRIFGDLDFDDDIDTADKALHGSLSTTNGWVMPVATNVFRMTQLQTDVDLPGVHTLSLSGDAFRVWQSAAPSTTNAPLLVSGQTVTNGVNGVSWGMNHTANVYIQAFTNGTATLTCSYIGTGSASGIVCRASMKMTALNFGIVPDYDRDRVIDWQDQAQASTNRVFRWWINDDDDNGTDVAEGANDVPGQGYGVTTVSNDTQWPDSATVDGRCDLLDFSPLWLDLENLLSAFPTNGNYTLRLSQADDALRAVYTDFAITNAGTYLVSAITNCGPDFAQATHEAETFLVDASGVELAQAFVNRIIADPFKGILLMEGCAETQNPLVLEVLRNGTRIAYAEMPLRISGVEDMYRFHNLRFDPELPERLGEPSNLPDAECGNVDVFLAHGFLVGEDESRAWGAEFFKRLWQEGSRARFHAVTWSSDEEPTWAVGPNMSYEYNVNNAFLTASNYAASVNAVKASNNSEVVVLAHSLGNMLTSAAICDWGMQADKYFALNGAVAAEAFDMSMVDVRTNALNRLLHPDWRDYKADTWSANYYRLFTNSAAFPNDARTNLTWRGRFANAAPVLYNFWSSGDEVLEVAEDAEEIDITSGIEWDWEWTWPPVSVNARRYVWHKQVLFKGRSLLYGTTWAGWEFWKEEVDDEWIKVYTLAQANALTDDELRAAPVFRHNPDEMFTSNIVQSVQDNLLARGIPELSFSIGYTNVPLTHCVENVDMNSDSNIRRSDQAWPERDIDFNDYQNTRPNRWLHTDLMNVAHYYTYRLFEAIVTKGNMK